MKWLKGVIEYAAKNIASVIICFGLGAVCAWTTITFAHVGVYEQNRNVAVTANGQGNIALQQAVVRTENLRGDSAGIAKASSGITNGIQQLQTASAIRFTGLDDGLGKLQSGLDSSTIESVDGLGQLQQIRSELGGLLKRN